MLIKICGLTNQEDICAVCDCDVDCVGFVLYPKSPRYVKPEKLSKLAATLPAGVRKVGIFVNEKAEEVVRIAQDADLDVIQYHGNEMPDFIEHVGLPAWKALGLRDEQHVAETAEFPGVECLLVDAVSGGGTGKTCDWRLAAMLADLRPVILAGGLTPDNVAAAIQQVRPFGIDVSSGVEIEPGRKDHGKLCRFVENARKAIANLCEKETE